VAAVPRVDPPFLDEAEGVLSHHDGGVHQHPDRDGDPGQRHDVGGDTEISHEQERREHGQGDGDRHDQDRAEVEQEQDVHQGDHRGLLEECPLERGGGSVDQRRAVIERHDPDPGWEPALQGRHLLLDPGDDVGGADAIAGDHHPAHRLLTTLDQRRNAERVAHPHRRHLPQVDRHAVLGADDRVLEIARRLDQPETADHRPGAAGLEDVSADVPVAAHDGISHRRKRHPEAAEAVRIHVDLVLAHHTAHGRHLGHPRHRIELVADEPVLERAQLLKGLPRPLHRVPEDVPDSRGVRAQGGHDARGQALGQQVEAFEHARARKVEVDPILEDHVDHGEAEGRGGADHPDTGQALEAHGQRIRDLILNFLRRATGPVGEDDHLIVGEIGDRVDRGRQQRPVAPAAEEQKGSDDQHPIAQRQLDEPVDHPDDTSPFPLGPQRDADAHLPVDRRAQREDSVWN
jgi:hypothetical protein